jgi:hypothetical protein
MKKALLMFDGDGTLYDPFLKLLFQIKGYGEKDYDEFIEKLTIAERDARKVCDRTNTDNIWIDVFYDEMIDGKFENLLYVDLISVGKRLHEQFKPGIPELFVLLRNKYCIDASVHTSGSKDVVDNSKLAGHLDSVWGLKLYHELSDSNYIFDMWKGTYSGLEKLRGLVRVVEDNGEDPNNFSSVIYVSDMRRSDRAMNAAIRRGGGVTICVADYEEELNRRRAEKNAENIDYFHIADYRENSLLYETLCKQIEKIAI